MRQQSLKLDEMDWQALMGIARELGCEYRGEPSWRRLIDWIASGKLTVLDKPDKRIEAFQAKMRRGRREQQEQRLMARIESDRQRQE